METLSEVVKRNSHLGTSAGSNICGLTMQTTNDMPIFSPSFKTLGLIPFNLNPHYRSRILNIWEKQEKPEEYHAYNWYPS
jgi:dipeptidase E